MKSNCTYKDALDAEIFKHISKATRDLSFKSYVIGGYVRDYFLKRYNVKDIDVVVLGSGIELAQKVAHLLPGRPKVKVFKTYGTAMFCYKGFQVEFVGARKESYSKDSRNPIVSQGTLEEDQNRRDFTINTLALSLNESDYGVLLDYFSGLSDLKAKIIRTPLDPTITYCDDPLRMIRAIRFACELSFLIEERSLSSIKENIKRIEIITNERIIEEINKIISSSKPSIGFLLMDKVNLLSYLIPELTSLKGVDEIDGLKHKDNFYHTLEVLDNISKKTEDIWLRWAALLHDIGKAPTKKFNKKNGWTFHGHEFVSSKMVYRLFKRMRLPLNAKMRFVQKMVLLSSRPIALANQVTDSAVRRLLFDAGEDIESLMTLCEADITTKNIKKYKKYYKNFQIVRKKIKEVEQRDRIRNFQPPISGELIMETFNIKPSRSIGIIKESIKDAILEGEITNDYEVAFEFMLKKGIELGLRVNKAKH